MSWLFYAVDQGTNSDCALHPSAIGAVDGSIKGVPNPSPPFPAGVFPVKTQEGDCEYKNNGDKDNAGALFCGGKQMGSCKANADKDKSQRDGDKICDNLTGTGGRNEVTHRAVVACEW
ncbi:hypothetical protein K469DRAFT_720657 [Zopfia rhizophila CBS 207.26]|uniref:Uncharacterized protein n=1 Tax=Zopfia rhizophila CBS 207.26 TaxID=1314779 RepID=A0A6A6EKZ4_9PEZI|nr:hypothetical protein K469DRAFT_720657 [Zopfia rhizophila CBS 207.26]